MSVKYWPLKKGFQITSPFGPRWGTFHAGTDFGWEGGSANLPVHAVKGGTVIYAGAASGYGGPDPAGWIVIDHPTADGGGVSEYGHIIREVQVGQRVEAGQRIGRINPDSRTNGEVAPHLHLSVMPYEYNPNKKIDPVPWLEGALYPGDAPPKPAPLPAGLTAETLSQAMGGSLPIERYRQLLPGFVNAMIAAQCTTVERAAMWCAQIGHESAGLRYMEEIASGAAYNGRADLGNTQPGDGPRFKGSGPIQLTGRHNFRKFSEWCHAQGWVDSPRYFEDRPQLVREDPKWGFLAATWYWVVARPNINTMADARDLVGVTRAINGGTNGLADRQLRYKRCLELGAALLPKAGDAPMSAQEVQEIKDFIVEFCGPIGSDTKDVRQQLTGGRDAGEYPGWEQLGFRTVTDAIAQVLLNQVAIAERLEALEKGKNDDVR